MFTEKKAISSPSPSKYLSPQTALIYNSLEHISQIRFPTLNR